MAGYGKIADLMTKHSEVATFQRFDFLNTLDILLLQAELVHMEQELRACMKADLESGNSPAPVDSNTPPPRPPSDEADGDTTPPEPSEFNDRAESAKNWYILSHMRDNSTWRLMLRLRQKLKEYDEAILRYTQMRNQSSPNSKDVEFLQRWFTEKTMGDFPLLGPDRHVWRTSPTPELIALKARKGEDPLGSWFLSTVYVWWNDYVGHWYKKQVDAEAQYFEYSDRRLLRVANIIGSIISSALLVGSVMALAFVENIYARLGIVAAFTQIFSLALVLVTNARKVEMFAATAAFVAVQVVFVGSTTTINSTVSR